MTTVNLTEVTNVNVRGTFLRVDTLSARDAATAHTYLLGLSAVTRATATVENVRECAGARGTHYLVVTNDGELRLSGGTCGFSRIEYRAPLTVTGSEALPLSQYNGQRRVMLNCSDLTDAQVLAAYERLSVHGVRKLETPDTCMRYIREHSMVLGVDHSRDLFTFRPRPVSTYTWLTYDLEDTLPLSTYTGQRPVQLDCTDLTDQQVAAAYERLSQGEGVRQYESYTTCLRYVRHRGMVLGVNSQGELFSFVKQDTDFTNLEYDLPSSEQDTDMTTQTIKLSTLTTVPPRHVVDCTGLSDAQVTKVYMYLVDHGVTVCEELADALDYVRDSYPLLGADSDGDTGTFRTGILDRGYTLVEYDLDDGDEALPADTFYIKDSHNFHSPLLLEVMELLAKLGHTFPAPDAARRTLSNENRQGIAVISSGSVRHANSDFRDNWPAVTVDQLRKAVAAITPASQPKVGVYVDLTDEEMPARIHAVQTLFRRDDVAEYDEELDDVLRYVVGNYPVLEVMPTRDGEYTVHTYTTVDGVASSCQRMGDINALLRAL